MTNTDETVLAYNYALNCRIHGEIHENPHVNHNHTLSRQLRHGINIIMH